MQVIAESLSEEELAGLKEMFKMIDTDNSGQITFEELKAGLERVGANLKESEIAALMEAVSVKYYTFRFAFGMLLFEEFEDFDLFSLAQVIIFFYFYFNIIRQI